MTAGSNVLGPRPDCAASPRTVHTARILAGAGDFAAVDIGQAYRPGYLADPGRRAGIPRARCGPRWSRISRRHVVALLVQGRVERGTRNRHVIRQDRRCHCCPPLNNEPTTPTVAAVTVSGCHLTPVIRIPAQGDHGSVNAPARRRVSLAKVRTHFDVSRQPAGRRLPRPCTTSAIASTKAQLG
jgi:hypothetical protein